MEINIKTLNESENEIEFILSYNEIKEEIENEVKKEIKGIQIDGFRKGKAPVSVIKKIYGDALEYQASEKVSNKKFFDYIKEQDIPMIGEPVMTDIDFKPGSDLKFKVQYELLPALENILYKDLSIEIPEFIMKDDEVEQEIKKMLAANAEYSEAEIISDIHHLITVDLQRVDDKGNIVEGMKQDGLKINLSEPQVNKDIVDAALNKKVGETFSFSFEDSHVHEHNGEHHHEKYFYNALIKEIKKITLPELTDEFVIKVTRSKVTTIDEFKTSVKKEIENYYEKTNEEFLENKLRETLINNNPFTPPKTVVENFLQRYVNEELEYYKKNKQKAPDVNSIRENMKSRAENGVKIYLIEKKIIEKEQLTADEEFLKETAEKNAAKLGVSQETLLNHYKSEQMKETMIYNQLFEFLKKKNNIVKIPSEQFFKKEGKKNEQ